MATLTRVTLVPVGASFAGTVAGQANGWQNAAAGGDLVPISSGRGTILRFKTVAAGTTVVVTLDSVVLTAYGSDVNPQVTLTTTDEQEIFMRRRPRRPAGRRRTPGRPSPGGPPRPARRPTPAP
jgi:hypothetical protein